MESRRRRLEVRMRRAGFLDVFSMLVTGCHGKLISTQLPVPSLTRTSTLYFSLSFYLRSGVRVSIRIGSNNSGVVLRRSFVVAHYTTYNQPWVTSYMYRTLCYTAQHSAVQLAAAAELCKPSASEADLEGADAWITAQSMLAWFSCCIPTHS